MSKPLYCLLRELCGLTISEAAAFHRCSINTVTKWSNGTREPKIGVLKELCALYRHIENASRSGPLLLDQLPCDGARNRARGLEYVRFAVVLERS